MLMRLLLLLLLPPLRDKLFPAFGFGAKLPPDYQVSALTGPADLPTAPELDMLLLFTCS